MIDSLPLFLADRLVMLVAYKWEHLEECEDRTSPRRHWSWTMLVHSMFIESRTTNWVAHREVALKTHLPKEKKKQTKKTPTSTEKWQPRHVSEGCRNRVHLLSPESHIHYSRQGDSNLRTFGRCVKEKLPALGGRTRSKSIWWMDIFKTCHIC